MSGFVTAVAVGTAGAAYQGHQARKAGKAGAESAERVALQEAEVTREIAANAEKLNKERFLEAQGLLLPRVEQSNIAQRQLMAEMGLPMPQQSEYMIDFDNSNTTGPWRIPKPTLVERPGQEQQPMQRNSAYMSMPSEADFFAGPSSMQDIPGYQQMMDESLRAAEQSAVSSGSTAYGGRRLKAAGEVGAGVQQDFYNNYMNRRQNYASMQQSYYNNYMNILQNMAQPQVAQNLASLGVGQGANIGAQNIAAGQAASGMITQGNQAANQYRMAGTQASNAAVGDVLGGLGNIYSGALAGGYI